MRLREPQVPTDDRHGLASDADHLRFPVLRLHADLDAARVVDLDPLFNDERRRGQLPAGREVRATGAGGASGRGILDPQFRYEPARVDVSPGGLGLESERIAHDLLTKLRENLLERPWVWIHLLYHIEGTAGYLEGCDPGRGDLGGEAFQPDVSDGDLERLRKRLDALHPRPEDRLALRHDDLLHLPALAEQLQRQDANLEFLLNDCRPVRMRCEARER